MDTFNTPLTGDRELMRRKKELARDLDAMRHSGHLHYSLHAKAIMAIHAAGNMAEVEAIRYKYNPQTNAA